MIALFVATSFLSATLLLALQPLVGRLVLPLLGGSPAVWSTCLAFYQAVLLAGYGYAHLLTRRCRPRTQVVVHAVIVLAAAVALPVAFPRGAAPPPAGLPVLWLLGVLAVVAGPPLLAVSATAPLLQHWFARTDHARARDPYFLYAAGNLGSVLGLLGYPLLLEPALALRAQGVAWSGAYAILVAGLAGCAWRSLRAGTRPNTAARDAGAPDAAPPTWRCRLLWLALAAAPSSLTLGVTQYISTDLAAIPLTWIVPLTIYLLTYVVAFAPHARLPLRALGALLLVAAPAVGALLALRLGRPIVPLIGAHLAVLALAALVCHGRLAAARPQVEHLTEYYFMIALGGVLGGAFNAFAAPALFDTVLEYPLALLAVCLLAPLGGWPEGAPARPATRLAAGRWWRPAFAGMLVVAFALLAHHAASEPGVRLLLRERTFFGVHEVTADENQWYVLQHGTTLHGVQSHFTDPRTGFAWARKPAAYYHESGPIGDVFRALFPKPPGGRAAVVGLGTGSLAAYAQPGQRFDFYEIDPEVARIASDTRWFTFLADARARGARVDIVLGDGRLTLARSEAAPYDLIVLDAFTSDAIPIHLLTREAGSVFRDRLAPGGVLAFHVSNRYFDFPPVLAALARELGMVAWFRDDTRLSPPQRAEAKRPSWWVLLARDDDDLGPLARDPNWRKLAPSPDVAVWTDDHANLLGVFRPGGLKGHRP